MTHQNNCRGISSDFLPVEYTGQTYIIRSSTSTISKIEVTNNGKTEELSGSEGNNSFIYTPNKGDEVVIHTHDIVSGMEEINMVSEGYSKVYDLNGIAIPDDDNRNSLNLRGKIYIKGGKKYRIR